MGDDDAEILILGTFPGEESLEKGEYYANSTNRFWKVILTLLGEKAEPFDYEVKKEILKRNKIALWDIYEKAVRGGSTDKNIKQKKSKFNDVFSWLKLHDSVKIVVFNGGKSKKNSTSKMFRKFKNEHSEEIKCAEKKGVKFKNNLPSTSGANVKSKLDDLILAWKDIFEK